MSSYLTFYLVPKKTRKKYDYNKDDGHTEIEVELSTAYTTWLWIYSCAMVMAESISSPMPRRVAMAADKAPTTPCFCQPSML